MNLFNDQSQLSILHRIIILLQQMMTNLTVITIYVGMQKCLSLEREKIHLRRLERIGLRKMNFNLDSLILINPFAFNNQQFDESLLQSFIVKIIFQSDVFQLRIVFPIIVKFANILLHIFQALPRCPLLLRFSTVFVQNQLLFIKHSNRLLQEMNQWLNLCHLNSINIFNCKNYHMSNIRDLMKLKGAKPIPILPLTALKLTNPQNNLFLYGQRQNNESAFTKRSKQKLKQQDYTAINSTKKLHKRGVSFGTPDKPDHQRLAFNQTNRLSIYNCTLKLNIKPLNHESNNEIHKFPMTQRKQRSNYVICKEYNPLKKKLVLVQKNQSNQITLNMFNFLFPIGKGGYGKVWKVEFKKNKQIYAIKQMSKAKVINKKSVSSVMNQRNFLARLSHPFIVNMEIAFQNRENLYLLMDYLDGGDLRYHLGNKQFFSEKQTKFFLVNIIIGLQYLHRNKIIHRDIKPENLVFDSLGFMRITDLGISRQLRQDNHQDTSGTPGYMAPEVMVRRSHSYTADYFALGVIAYELMLGNRPYLGANRKQIKQQILSRQVSVKFDELPYKWSPQSIDFINRLLLRNPNQRLGINGIEEIKEHPWLADTQWQKILQRRVKPPYKPISIEEDYESYKQQISEDTVNDNQDQLLLMLRKSSVQQLFQCYEFERSSNDSLIKKKTSYPTNSTDQNFIRK